MNKNKIKNIAGLTLIEIMIGIIITSIMMAAMYTTYSVVNKTYTQVTSRAKISRSGRDIIEMIMRDVRMAGFKYFLGINEKGDPIEFNTGNVPIKISHDPLIIIKNELGYTRYDPDTDTDTDMVGKWNSAKDLCCDKIHIVYDDYDQHDVAQPYKRYKITYFAKPIPDPPAIEGTDKRYGVFKTVESWKQESSKWVINPDCDVCYHNLLIRDHVVDMEFIPFGPEGTALLPPPRSDNNSNQDLYQIRSVDVRLTFKSHKEFYRSAAKEDKPRIVQGLGEDRTREYENIDNDKFLRDSVVVTIHTRNIGS
jgi:hypothetical protein